MNVSFKWLSRLVNLEGISPEDVAQKLPMVGVEVESVKTTGIAPMPHVVVGEILEKNPHPNADKLSVCKVQTEPDGAPRQIVCGAKNFKVGDRVPVALPGALLPGGFEIKEAALRGVPSGGMMCSARELGLGDDHSGLLILENRPAIGTPIHAVFGEGDTVLTLELTANRGDCLSHRGVAREVAAAFRRPLTFPESPVAPALAENAGEGSLLKGVRVESEDCPYYTGWSVKGVKIAPSPEWLQRDLKAVGLRPVNNVVDITNWVMYETGQPLHAFDVKKIAGGEIIVRRAREGEKLAMLDGRERALAPSMLVIADTVRPLVVAGVMGGVDAEIDDTTTDIFLESAIFNSGSVRLTARALGVSTDSSYRNARDVNPQETAAAARMAIAMMETLAGGKASGNGIAVGKPPRGDVAVSLTGDAVRERLGFDVADDDIQSVFAALGFPVEKAVQGWTVTVPAFRAEVSRPIDLVEEFLRIWGTDKIPAATVAIPDIEQEDDPQIPVLARNGTLLVGQAFAECKHYSIVDGALVRARFEKDGGDALALANPLTDDQSHLRPSLVAGLLGALALNRNNGNDARRLFEIGKVFRIRQDKRATELISAAFVMPLECLGRTWQPRQKPDFYAAKGLAVKLALCAGVPERTLFFEALDHAAWQAGHAAAAGSWQRDGWQVRVGLASVAMSKALGLDTPVLAGELVFTQEFLKRKHTHPRYKPFSCFPPSPRDIALVVDKAATAESVRKDLTKLARACVGKAFEVETVEIFDVYAGKGLPDDKKSLAFALAFRAADRTLTDAEVKTAFDAIRAKIAEQGKYAVRG